MKIAPSKKATPAPSDAPVPVPDIGVPPLIHGDEAAVILASVWAQNPLTIVPAAPGAGKTHRSVICAAHIAAIGKRRVLVTANTNAQAVEFANRLAGAASAVGVILLCRRGGTAETVAQVDPRVSVFENAKEIDTSLDNVVVIATAAKAGFINPTEFKADVLMVDEAWQCTFQQFLKVSVLADTYLLVGDPGQIDPVVTVPTAQWDNKMFAPHKPAPVVLQAARPDDCTIIQLSSTRRLGQATTDLIQPLYPFGLTSSRPESSFRYTPDGHAEPELIEITSNTSGGVADAEIARTIATQVEDAMTGFVTDHTGSRPVTATDIAVCCAHNSQVTAVTARVPEGVNVSTADRLQGLERSVVIVWDPLAGQAGCPEFNLDTGRLCVSLSRHRTQLRWVTTSDVRPELAKAIKEGTANAETNARIRSKLAA